MASGKSNYLCNKLLSMMLGGTAYSVPSTLYFALYTTTPGPANSGGVELTGNGYARASLTNNTTNFPAASSQQSQNAVAITWPVFTGGPTGTVVTVGILDAASAGNLLYYSDLASTYQKTYTTNDQPVIPIDALTITES